MEYVHPTWILIMGLQLAVGTASSACVLVAKVQAGEQEAHIMVHLQDRGVEGEGGSQAAVSTLCDSTHFRL
jgi:hypothetical protein